MWEAIGAVVAILVAIGGVVTWLTAAFEKANQQKSDRQKAYVEELRLSEVSVWAAESIDVMQRLVVSLRLAGDMVEESERRAKIRDCAFHSSVLIERGRMYFRNAVVDDFGSDKESAYQGYRPCVLDPLVVAYEIACRRLKQGHDMDCRLLAVAEDSARRFVSLVQAEVGRSRSASADTSQGGDGADLDYLLSKLPQERVERLCPTPH